MTKSFFLIAILTCTFSLITAQNEAEVDYSKELKKYRKDYKKALLVDERSPVDSKKELKSIDFFEPNEDYIVKCLFIRTAYEKPFEMATYAGITKPYLKYGELLFELPGEGTLRLSVYQSLKGISMPAYKDHLFIPFKDATNGDITYGGGRYIDIQVSDIKQGIVFLDFNKAYNPWCAYGDGFSCPIPPAENHLSVAIKAGELDFKSSENTTAKSL